MVRCSAPATAMAMAMTIDCADPHATAVMNYTEMESKVREATNNEPWGASSTQMQEIADGTFN